MTLLFCSSIVSYADQKSDKMTVHSTVTEIAKKTVAPQCVQVAYSKYYPDDSNSLYTYLLKQSRSKERIGNNKSYSCVFETEGLEEMLNYCKRVTFADMVNEIAYIYYISLYGEEITVGLCNGIVFELLVYDPIEDTLYADCQGEKEWYSSFREGINVRLDDSTIQMMDEVVEKEGINGL